LELESELDFEWELEWEWEYGNQVAIGVVLFTGESDEKNEFCCNEFKHTRVIQEFLGRGWEQKLVLGERRNCQQISFRWFFFDFRLFEPELGSKFTLEHLI
jgi:hypothetical protein